MARVQIPAGGKNAQGKYTTGPRFVISTGYKVEGKFWDAKGQKVKSAHPEAVHINTHLSRLAGHLKSLMNEAFVHGVEPLAYLRSQLKGGAEPDPTPDIIALIDQHLATQKSVVAPATLAVHRSTLHALSKFVTTERGGKLKPEDTTYEFLEAFCLWLIKERGFQNNTTERYVKQIKYFFNALRRKNIAINDSYLNYKTSHLDSDTYHIALSQEELKAIEALDLSDRPALARTRDGLLFLVHTGLRYSDFQALRPHHKQTGADGRPYLSLEIEKTEERLHVPLSAKALAIFEQYGGHFQAIDRGKFAAQMKEIGKLAGVDTPCEVIRHQGSEKIRQVRPKYELLSAHTCRRTAATLMVEGGVNLEYVRRMLGHASVEQTIAYVKASDTRRLRETAAFFDQL